MSHVHERRSCPSQVCGHPRRWEEPGWGQEEAGTAQGCVVLQSVPRDHRTATPATTALVFSPCPAPTRALPSHSAPEGPSAGAMPPTYPPQPPSGSVLGVLGHCPPPRALSRIPFPSQG